MPEDTKPPQPEAPNMHSFTLNSREFYEAVTPPPDPWLWGPRLPRDPRSRDLPVIVQPSSEKTGRRR